MFTAVVKRNIFSFVSFIFVTFNFHFSDTALNNMLIIAQCFQLKL